MNSQQVLNYFVTRYGSADWKDKWEAQRYCYYDYARIPNAGTPTLPFFVNALGTVDPTSALQKTFEQTNLVKSGSFGQQYYLVEEIKTHLFLCPQVRQPAAIAALPRFTLDNGQNVFWQSFMNLSNQGVLRLFIMNKERLQVNMPFVNCPPGFGTYASRNAFTVLGGLITNVSYWAQQNPAKQDVFACTPPVMFEPEVQFRVQIDFPNANSQAIGAIAAAAPAVDVGVLFDGYIIRPKQ